jgi:hypothetical protein
MNMDSPKEQQNRAVHGKPSYTVNKDTKMYRLVKGVADTLTEEEVKDVYTCIQVNIWFDETEPYAERIRPLFTNRYGRLRSGVFEAMGVIWDERYIQEHLEDYR